MRNNIGKRRWFIKKFASAAQKSHVLISGHLHPGWIFVKCEKVSPQEQFSAKSSIDNCAINGQVWLQYAELEVKIENIRL